jgi:hypothetical protein
MRFTLYDFTRIGFCTFARLDYYERDHLIFRLGKQNQMNFYQTNKNCIDAR